MLCAIIANVGFMILKLDGKMEERLATFSILLSSVFCLKEVKRCIIDPLGQRHELFFINEQIQEEFCEFKHPSKLDGVTVLCCKDVLTNLGFKNVDNIMTSLVEKSLDGLRTVVKNSAVTQENWKGEAEVAVY